MFNKNQITYSAIKTVIEVNFSNNLKAAHDIGSKSVQLLLSGNLDQVSYSFPWNEGNVILARFISNGWVFGRERAILSNFVQELKSIRLEISLCRFS